MAYATVADMIKRFSETELIQLTDRLGDGVVDDVVAAQALADASSVVDGHLSGRYQLPLATVPDILVGYACDLARRNLYTNDIPDVVESRAKEAINYLRAVGEGRLSLFASVPATGANTVQVVVGDRRRNGIGL